MSISNLTKAASVAAHKEQLFKVKIQQIVNQTLINEAAVEVNVKMSRRCEACLSIFVFLLFATLLLHQRQADDCV